MIDTIVSLGRFFGGRDLDGRGRTNARWAHSGTELINARHAGRWAHYSHRRRATIRSGSLVATVVVIYGATTSWWSTITTLRLAFWLGLAVAAWVVVHKTRKWSHHQQWVVPTALALADQLDVSRHRDPLDWLHVPVGHRDDPDRPVTITLPVDFNAGEPQRKRLVATAAARLGMQTPAATFALDANPPTLTLTAHPGPPPLVTFEDVRPHFEAAAESDLVIGLAANGRPVTMSLDTDSPHLLCSIGSGGGKSEFCAWTCEQFLRRGARVVYVDIVKRGASARWAKGVPGVEVIRQTAVAHDRLLALFEEIQSRCESYWHKGYVSDEQRVLLVIDEANRTVKELQRFWQNDLGETKQSPAVSAIEGTLFVGREARTNVLTVGQRMSAAASGGGDAREAYGGKLANRFSRQTARMLFSDVGDGRAASLPKSSNHPGRVQFVTNGRAIEVQTPLTIDRTTKALPQEVRDWIAAGVPQPCDLGSSLRNPPSAEAGGRRLVVVGDSGQSSGIGLREAVTRGVVSCSVEALRTARKDDTAFPRPVDRRGPHATAEALYDPADLAAWERNRVRAEVNA